jgi:trigger factor
MQEEIVMKSRSVGASDTYSNTLFTDKFNKQEELRIMKEEGKYPIVQLLEEPEYCRSKYHYEADPQVVNGKIDEAVAECRQLQVPGFRKGKAPDHAIKIRLRPQINQYVVREMANHALDDIIFETNIKPIGQPKFSEIKVTKNNFSCDIELTKKPDFELSDLTFEVAKPVFETDEEALAERSLYNLRLQVGSIQPYEENDFVENGDQVTFSFTASIDGESFDGSVVEGEMYTIGSNRWTGFDENLFGMKAEEVRDFEFKFKDGPLLDKTAKFSVTVHMGTKKKPHPIDEEVLKMMGIETVEEMLTKLRSISKMSLERNKQDAIRSQVAVQLLDRNKFEIPKFIIEEEAKYLAAQSRVSFETISDEEKLKFINKAEENARLSLILDSVRENEPDSVLNDIEARNMIATHVQAQGGDPSRVFNNPAHLAMLLGSVKDEFTLQWVSDKATIIE